jgi:phosphatidylserine/phosphatidylglycerophosphate/cardiolipin synthase-like enzyme
MRKSVTQNGLVVKAYAGVTGVLLAFNLENDIARKGLLGFAIERANPDGTREFLDGMVGFQSQPHSAGVPIPTNQAPIQKFRWSDYTVRPGTTYSYVVHPVRGTPAQLQLDPGTEVSVTTESNSAAQVMGNPGKIVTVSNRAVASSQAFSREFPDTTKQLTAALGKPTPKGQATKTEGILSDPEMAWLSNGLKEEIVSFINLAKDSGSALDIAIYQYELPDIYEAIDAASKDGVLVRLIYHAKKGDTQTAKNVLSAAGLPAEAKFGRVTNAIFHHKFIILSKVVGGARRAQAVLCGSTNFTLNGVYAQANNVQITSDPAVMANYVSQFEFLFNQPAHTPAVTSVHDTEQNMLSPSLPLQVGFSPRSGRGDLTLFASFINAAHQDVLFATAFGIDPVVMQALEGQPHDSILRYGIQDKPTANVTGIHADRTADFEAAATLPTGIEGWLDEHRMPGVKGTILIHDKIIVVDFSSDQPLVINGSHNYSNAASQSNDENYLIIRGNTDVADCLGVEVLRLYDHYRFRFVTGQKMGKVGGKPALTQAPFFLSDTDSWTDDYYDPAKLKFADRVVFSGTVSGGPTPPAPAPGLAASRTIQQIRSSAQAPGTAEAAPSSPPAPRKKKAVAATGPKSTPKAKARATARPPAGKASGRKAPRARTRS